MSRTSSARGSPSPTCCGTWRRASRRRFEICALLTKPSRREIDIHCRYTGFEIPNKFVIGYGLDFAERYRNLPFVGVIRDELAAQAEELS